MPADTWGDPKKKPNLPRMLWHIPNAGKGVVCLDPSSITAAGSRAQLGQSQPHAAELSCELRRREV